MGRLILLLLVPLAGEFIDSRDGTTYRAIRIGTQTWLAGNLRFDAGAGSRCLENNPDHCVRLGRLYDWPTAMRACPSGWRLPAEADWQAVERLLGMPEGDLEKTRYRGSDEGARLRNALDVVLAGYMRPDGTPRRLDERAAFWTATEDEAGSTSWHRDFSDDPRIYRSAVEQNYFLSVRCVAHPSH